MMRSPGDGVFSSSKYIIRMRAPIANPNSSVPFGVLAIALVLIALPTVHRENEDRSRTSKWANCRRLDILGAALLIGASILLVTSLLEASVQLGWRASLTIALLVLSGSCWIGFFGWELFTIRSTRPEPTFPWTFSSNRTWVGMLL